MLYCKLTATLKTPCCLSEQPAMGNEVETLDYIPGTALRGMLAHEYLRRGGRDDATFRQLFCSDEIHFPNLYPVHQRPLPLSAHTCKRHPGFKNDPSKDGLCHGVWDLLFANRPDCDPTAKERRHMTDSCGGPLKPHSGSWYVQERGVLKTPKRVSQLLRMRTAVGAHGSALEASLHVQQELAAGSRFAGVLTAPAALDPQQSSCLWVLLGQFGMSPDRPESLTVLAYTGRRRAGQVAIWIQPPDSVAERQAKFLEPWPAEADFLFLVMTFRSDVLLLDALLRPVVTLDRQGILLKRYCNERKLLPDNLPVTVEKAFVATRRVSGWNAVAQIYKPDDLAMVRGSTFLLRVRKSDQALVRQWMEDLLAHGIGVRRAEGFGQVSFDEPFHHAAAACKGEPL